MQEKNAGFGWLLFCGFGMISSLTLYGIVLEFATSGGRKLHEISFIFVTTSIYSFTAYLARGFFEEKPSKDISKYQMLVISVMSIASAYTSVRSLRYVIYPVQVLFKSCKPVPLMIFGVLLGQKYSIRKYVNVIIITIGVALFMGGGTSTAKKNEDSSGVDTTLMGALILSISLCFDGATGAYEDKLMSGENSVGPYDLMFNIQLGKSVISFCALIATNGVNDFLKTVSQGGLSLVLLGITGAVGQIFLFITIAKFGALNCALLGLLRKMLSLVLSFVLYGHSLNAPQTVGLALAVAAMSANFLGKSESSGHGHSHGSSSSSHTNNNHNQSIEYKPNNNNNSNNNQDEDDENDDDEETALLATDSSNNNNNNNNNMSLLNPLDQMNIINTTPITTDNNVLDLEMEWQQATPPRINASSSSSSTSGKVSSTSSNIELIEMVPIASSSSTQLNLNGNTNNNNNNNNNNNSNNQFQREIIAPQQQSVSNNIINPNSSSSSSSQAARLKNTKPVNNFNDNNILSINSLPLAPLATSSENSNNTNHNSNSSSNANTMNDNKDNATKDLSSFSNKCLQELNQLKQECESLKGSSNSNNHDNKVTSTIAITTQLLSASQPNEYISSTTVPLTSSTTSQATSSSSGTINQPNRNNSSNNKIKLHKSKK